MWSAIIVPHVGVGPGTPAPRYDSVVSNRMARRDPERAVDEQQRQGVREQLLAEDVPAALPTARAASTNWASRRTTIRAVDDPGGRGPQRLTR